MTIENLELEVKQSGIGQAANALGRLKTAIAGLKTVSDQGLNFKPIKEAVDSLKGMEKVDVGPSLGKLANGLKSLNGELGNTHSDSLKALASALKSLHDAGKVDSIPKGFTDGIKNISDAMANVDAGSISKLDKLGTALSKFTGIGTIPKNLGERIKEISTAASTLDSGAIRKLSRLGDALQKFKGLSGVGISARDARNVGNAARAASDASGETGTADSTRTSGSLFTNSEGKSTILGSIRNGAFSTIKKEIPFVNELSSAFSNVSSNAAGAAGAVAMLAAKFAIWSIKEIISNYKKIASAIKNVGVSAAKYLWSTTPFARFTQSLGETIKKISQFTRSIGRVAFYRLIRAAISEVTTAFSEGIEAVYKYDSAINGSFAKTMDGLQQKFNQLKASLGTLAANIINLVGPALNAILNIVIKLSDGISALFAALGGGIFYKAADGAGTYADALGSASGAAQEYKNQLLGFDEINKLEDSSSSGSGSSSGIAFQSAQLAEWLQNIQDLIAQQKFEEAGRALAEHLNGIIDDWDAVAWGTELGTKIQHAIEFALGFMEDFDFNNAAGKVADALGSLITSINPEDLGELLADEWNAVIESIDGFITKLQDYNLGEWLGRLFTSWFANINTDAAITAVDDAVKFVLDSIGDFISKFSLSDTVTNVSNFLYNAFTSAADIINGSDLPQKLADWINKVDWDDAAQKLSNAAVALLDALVNLWDELDVPAIADKILTALSKIDWASIMGDITHIAMEWFTIKLNAKIAIVGGKIGSVWDAFWGSLAKTAGNELWTEEDEAKTTASNIESTYDTTFSSITEEASTAAAEATNIATSGAGDFSTAYNDALANLGTGVGNFQYDTFSASQDALDDVEANSEEIDSVSTETAKAIREEIATAVQDSGEVFAQGMSQMIEAIQAFQSDSGESFGALKTQISEDLTYIVHEINTKMVSIKEVYFSKLELMKSKTDTEFSSIVSEVSTSMSRIQSTISSYMNNCVSMVQSAASQMKSALNMSTSMSYSFSGSINSSTRITTRASGGFVDSGNLFIAGEAGPELVGQIGSKTAVANNEQIIEGIRSGVYDAMVSAMSSKNNNSNVNVYLDGLAMARRIYPYTKQVANEHGTSLING